LRALKWLTARQMETPNCWYLLGPLLYSDHHVLKWLSCVLFVQWCWYTHKVAGRHFFLAKVLKLHNLCNTPSLWMSAEEDNRRRSVPPHPLLFVPTFGLFNDGVSTTSVV